MSQKRRNHNGLISRREFILLSSFSLGALLIPIPGCKYSSTTKHVSNLTEEEERILIAILDVLFPEDDYGPSHKDINALQYIKNVLNDPFYDGDIKVFIIEGIELVDALAKEMYKKNMVNLSLQERAKVIDEALERGGKYERWISRIITLIIEALLSDPIYGGNKDEMGWKWLNHFVGYPRPDAETTYQKLYPWKSFEKQD